MRVVPVASTILWVTDDGKYQDDYAIKETGYDLHTWDSSDKESWITNADELAEAAGRLCYLSFDRPNPKTAQNKEYLQNIINQQHFSVLEHASVTFYVDGVSRSLLTELERHRHLSFSVVSQRYVDESDSTFITPPGILKNPGFDQEFMAAELDDFHTSALGLYRTIYYLMTAHGATNKQAREAARSVLPNATETKFFVTGNLRVWREILDKRLSIYADAEIQLLAQKILDELKKIAPNSFQDF